MCKINYKSSTIYRTILKPTEIQIVLNDIGNVLWVKIYMDDIKLKAKIFEGFW